jgi:hypothetical protein
MPATRSPRNPVWSDLNALLPLALACFLLAAVETAAIGRTFNAKHGGRLDANQALFSSKPVLERHRFEHVVTVQRNGLGRGNDLNIWRVFDAIDEPFPAAAATRY